MGVGEVLDGAWRKAGGSTCSGAMVMPRLGRSTRPCTRICSIRPFTLSMGMAKPTPEEPPRPPASTIAAQMPISRPRLSRSTPPESASNVKCSNTCQPPTILRLMVRPSA